MSAMQSVFRWLSRHFLSFVMIVLILATAKFFQSEIDELKSTTSEISRLEQLQNSLLKEIDQQKQAVVNKAKSFERASIERLQTRRNELRQKINNLKNQTRSPLERRMAILDGSFVEDVKIDITIELLQQEISYITRLHDIALNRQRLAVGRVELERLRRNHVAEYSKLISNRTAQVTLKDNHPIAYRIPLTPAHEELSKLEAEHSKLFIASQKAHEQYRLQKNLLDLISIPQTTPQFVLAEEKVNQLTASIYSQAASLREKQRTNWVNRLSTPVLDVIPVALWILAGIILMPFLLKAIMYYLIAPLASRCAPIRLMPGVSGAIGSSVDFETGACFPGRISSVSKTLKIDASEELLVHPEYLQSTSNAGKKDTKWMLDWRCPFTSLASGMFALTRIRPASEELYVISSTKDPLSEVAVITLPDEAAVVLQPHNLVGVIQSRSAPVKITRRWQLGKLNAWLTLQLRYIVFHGQVKLIVSGCRGVRVEQAGLGRSINQAATIGFSANLAYATTRCETFAAYLMGNQELFNDQFTQGPGVYIYQEMPLQGQGGIVAGKGLQGLADSILKAFGI